jgi:multimeric flavodoxin WrbA
VGALGKQVEEVKLLGICGSPRKGNSLFLLEQALDGAIKAYSERVITDIYSFSHVSIAPCDACQAHRRHNGECRIQDGFQELRNKWLEADAIIYSIPIYHMGVPGQVKCFIDRLGNTLGYYFSDFFPGKPVFHIPRLMKPIGCITQGSHLFAGQEHVQAFINTHALLMRCIPVVGDLWETYIGTGGWTEGRSEVNSLKELAKEKKLDTEIAVRSARTLGKRIIEMALIIKDGLFANVNLLADQETYHPVLKKISEKGSLNDL